MTSGPHREAPRAPADAAAPQVAGAPDVSKEQPGPGAETSGPGQKTPDLTREPADPAPRPPARPGRSLGGGGTPTVGS